ncbi:MAG: hypothetical protein AB3N12_01465 [Ruegeria sp.]
MPIAIAASTIAQQAFREMEVAPIGSFADGSPQAAAASEQYPDALNAMLEAHDWSFASKIVQLPQISGTEETDPDLIYRYKLPSDLVALRRVYPKGLKFRRDGNEIRCTQSGGLTVRYTWSITNEALLPSTFKRVVSLELAIRLAPQYVSSRTKRADLKNDLIAALDACWTSHKYDASHDRLDDLPEQSDWACEATR